MHWCLHWVPRIMWASVENLGDVQWYFLNLRFCVSSVEDGMHSAKQCGGCTRLNGYIPHHSLLNRVRGELQWGIGLRGPLFAHKVVKAFALTLQFICPCPNQSRHLYNGCANLIPSHIGVIPRTARQPLLSIPQINPAKNSVLFLELAHEKLNTLLESDKQNLFWGLHPSETTEDGARDSPRLSAVSFAGCWSRLESAFDMLLKDCLSEPWGALKQNCAQDQVKNSH